MKIVKSNAMIKHKNRLYFVDYRVNLFGYVNLTDNNTVLVGIIPDVGVYKRETVRKMLSWREYIILVLSSESKVWLYNTNEDTWTEIVLNASIKQHALMDAILYKNKLYITGLFDRSIYCINLIDRSHNQICVAPQIAFWGFVMTVKDNYLYVPYLTEPHILKIDMNNNTYEYVDTLIEDGLYGITFDGEKFAVVTNKEGPKNEIGYWTENGGVQQMNSYCGFIERGLVSYMGCSVVAGYGDINNKNKISFTPTQICESTDSIGYLNISEDYEYVYLSRNDGGITVINKKNGEGKELYIEIEDCNIGAFLDRRECCNTDGSNDIYLEDELMELSDYIENLGFYN